MSKDVENKYEVIERLRFQILGEFAVDAAAVAWNLSKRVVGRLRGHDEQPRPR